MAPHLSRSLKSAAPVLLVCLLVQGLLGWIGVRTWLTSHNTLLANGNWVSTKTGLELGVLGAYNYIQGRQALAGGRLNLGAWHGYQEILWHRQVEGLESLEFELRKGRRGGWLAVIFNRDPAGGRFNAVRLGASGPAGGALLTVGEGGRFLDSRPLTRGPAPGPGTTRVRLDFGPERLSVLLDGESAGEFELARSPLQQFGFRGGKPAPSVDNVVARLAGGRVLRDSFDAPAGSPPATAAVATAVVLLNLALFLLLAARLEGDGRQLGLYFLMVNLTLVIIAVLVFLFVVARSDWYPGLGRSLEEKEAYFRQGESQRILDQVDQRFRALRAEERYRILFVGSSQTWGAGALRAEETFVARLERILDSARPGGPPVACINGGISATRARDLAPYLSRWLEAGRPDMVVINLTSNDQPTPPDEFAATIRGMVDETLAAGARPVLVKEPRISLSGRHRGLHAELDRIAADYGIPAIDLQTPLRAARPSGFLWWDQVHLTSYGQELVAERLAGELLPLLATVDKEELQEKAGQVSGRLLKRAEDGLRLVLGL